MGFSPGRVEGPEARGDEFATLFDLIGQSQAYLRSLRRGEAPDAAEAAAWERFYGSFAPVIERVVRTWRLPAAEFDDCVQDVWCKLIARLERFQCDPARGRFPAWLMVLAAHVRADRRRWPIEGLAPALAAHLPGREEDPAVACERNLVCDEVRRALVGLRTRVSPSSYQVLHLRWIEGRTMAEIAAALRLTPEQVRARHHRTLLRLRTQLERRPKSSRPAAADRPRPPARKSRFA